MLENEKDGTKMLLIEDNGGGIDPDKMRQCMSFGYSAKSKIANCIGQYGNGFKTSTMRLGADVIVFSRSCGKEGKSHTKSIGMLSYTFLRSTGKEDIVVPMLDYEKRGQHWEKMLWSSVVDWNKNVDIIAQWSPYSSEVDLLKQFDLISDHSAESMPATPLSSSTRHRLRVSANTATGANFKEQTMSEPRCMQGESLGKFSLSKASRRLHSVMPRKLPTR